MAEVSGNTLHNGLALVTMTPLLCKTSIQMHEIATLMGRSKMLLKLAKKEYSRLNELVDDTNFEPFALLDWIRGSEFVTYHVGLVGRRLIVNIS